MKTNPYVMSFVTNSDGTMVSVHLDLEGANLLINELIAIRDALKMDDCPHAHLFSYIPDKASLTNTMLPNQPLEYRSVQHVKLYGWNDEWVERHGLRVVVNNADGQ